MNELCSICHKNRRRNSHIDSGTRHDLCLQCFYEHKKIIGQADRAKLKNKTHECIFCKTSFESYWNRKNYCSEDCRLGHKEKLKIEKANSQWSKGNVYSPPLPTEYAKKQFAQGYAYHKEPAYLKKFKTVRG